MFVHFLKNSALPVFDSSDPLWSSGPKTLESWAIQLFDRPKTASVSWKDKHLTSQKTLAYHKQDFLSLVIKIYLLNKFYQKKRKISLH